MEKLTVGEIDKIKNGTLDFTFDLIKPLIRPDGISNGIMGIDTQKCIKCGLCVQNCPFKCWEIDENKIPRLKIYYICFSCFNCMVACPRDAISIVQTFSIKDGFFDTEFPLFKPPLEPRDEKGKPAEWNEVEQIIIKRRSVRNFKKNPVPEPLILRVLEAGRFAPSAGNHQPWKFVVVTDPVFIQELEYKAHSVWEELWNKYQDDNQVLDIVKDTPIAVFDPRVSYGLGCVARKELPIFFNAPAVIFIAGHRKMADPEIHIGITGQNMNIAAKSLGLGFCWSGFGRAVNFIPELLAKLGIGSEWILHTVVCLGYPRFKQEGIVPRHYRPITWFRPGSDKPFIENNHCSNNDQ